MQNSSITKLWFVPLFVFVFLFPLSVFADNVEFSGISQEQHKVLTCISLHGLADSIMARRQEPNSNIVEMLAIAEESDESIRDLVISFVLLSFTEPAWKSEELRLRAIDTFSHEVFLACLEEF